MRLAGLGKFDARSCANDARARGKQGGEVCGPSQTTVVAAVRIPRQSRIIHGFSFRSGKTSAPLLTEELLPSRAAILPRRETPGRSIQFFACSVINDIEVDIAYDQRLFPYTVKLNSGCHSRDLFFELPENFLGQMAIAISRCCQLIKGLIRNEAGRRGGNAFASEAKCRPYRKVDSSRCYVEI